mmetsp:Transcript_61957/g.175982  ORF Transcript_61957/g.175982 Transcript_61957/m.175982 type:complete len:542 (-) Transcript_61957:207-1832(-)
MGHAHRLRGHRAVCSGPDLQSTSLPLPVESPCRWDAMPAAGAGEAEGRPRAPLGLPSRRPGSDVDKSPPRPTPSTRSSWSSAGVRAPTSTSTCSDGSAWSTGVESSSCCTTPEVVRQLFPEIQVADDDSEVSSTTGAVGKSDLESPLLGDLAAAVAAEGGDRVYWESFFVILPIFCGYATLFGLQHEIKARLRIADDSSEDSHSFGFATSLLYVFNLIFRFGHGVFFGCFTPRQRVFLSIFCMAAALIVVAVPIMILGQCFFRWVALAYALGGVAVGCFESNFLFCLTPFGHKTKRVAITAIPVGVSLVLVGGFLVMGPPLYASATAIYLTVASLVLSGAVVMMLRIPRMPAESGQVAGAEGFQRSGARQLAADIWRWRAWLPQFWHYPSAFVIDQLALSACVPGVALFMYNQPAVILTRGWVVPTKSFFAMFNTCGMLGGLTGRWLGYRVRPRHPLVYTLLTAVGVTIILMHVPRLAPLGAYCVCLGDGLIYGTTSRYIDTSVPREFNLTAISFWLFIGDFGSVTGSNLISYIRDWVVGS